MYLNSARRNLGEINEYLARESGNRAVARAFIARLRAKRTALAALSGLMGRARPEYGQWLRSTPFGNYLIFFRYEAGELRIVAVIEGHRDLASALASEGD